MKNPETLQEPLSSRENLIVGAFSGALETTLQMPILTAKLCMQEGRPFPTYLTGWYRGVTIQAGTVAPITAIQFAANGFFLSVAIALHEHTGKEPTNTEKITTSVGAGAVSALVYSPVDLITIQQQKRRLGSIQTAGEIIRHHGITRGLFRGFASCVARESIYTCGYLGVAPLVKSYLSRHVVFFDGANFAASVASACIAGTCAAFITHPIDTAKTCVQADIKGEKWTSVRNTISLIIKKQGFRGLFKGFGARALMTCVSFYVCMSIQQMAIEYKAARNDCAKAVLSTGNGGG